MKERRFKKEMEERQLERELEAKLQSEKLAEQERLQLERAKVERKNIKARAEVRSAASSQAGQDNVATVTKTPGLRGFGYRVLVLPENCAKRIGTTGSFRRYVID